MPIVAGVSASKVWSTKRSSRQNLKRGAKERISKRRKQGRQQQQATVGQETHFLTVAISDDQDLENRQDVLLILHGWGGRDDETE